MANTRARLPLLRLAVFHTSSAHLPLCMLPELNSQPFCSFPCLKKKKSYFLQQTAFPFSKTCFQGLMRQQNT